MGRFPVLMYHRIVSDRCPVPGGDREEVRYAVSLGDFESQIHRITENGCPARVDFYAPPGGKIDPRRVAQLKRLSYLAVCNSIFVFNRTDGPRFEFNRIALTATTTPAAFAKVLEGPVYFLLLLYARDRGLRWAKWILGKKTYARTRSSSLGG